MSKKTLKNDVRTVLILSLVCFGMGIAGVLLKIFHATASVQQDFVSTLMIIAGFIFGTFSLIIWNFMVRYDKKD